MILVPTDQIPELIDLAFATRVNPCNNITLQASGFVNEVYSEEEKRTVLYVNSLKQQWSLDDSAQYNTIHVVLSGTKDSAEEFGTYEEGVYSIQCIFGVINFGPEIQFLSAIQAIESVEGLKVVSFNCQTMSVLRNTFKLKFDDNFNLPPYATAFTVTYEIKNVGFYE
ncbi:hypothetical protein [Runella zeae]|uniref:hypothetical protein n=1 Tax=Runella zeae TaxID=94255 RepID=UPI00048C80B1|nr:hypothetical protein [Runella zeae]